MAINAPPDCPAEGCDGNLYREFVTGLNRSTAQMMLLGGYALIVVPLLLVAPELYSWAMRGSGTLAQVMAAAIGVPILVIAGVMLLRRRSDKLSQRAEQQRCNKCGTIFPAAG